MSHSNSSLASELIEMIRKYIPIKETARPIKKGPDAILITESGICIIFEVKSSSSTMVVRHALEQLKSYAVELSEHAQIIRVLGVPDMGMVGQRLCEEADAGWIDLNGNAHIRGPGIVIQVSGRKVSKKTAASRFNPFAIKSSRLIKRLLIDPQHWFSQREMSQAAELDEGYVSKIVKQLEREQHLARDKDQRFKAKSPNALLEEWLESYNFEKHRRISVQVGARSGSELLEIVGEKFSKLKIEYAFTGLSGAWLLAKHANFRLGTALVENIPDADTLESIGLHTESRGANLWIVASNDSDPLRTKWVVDGFPCADPVQVYLDLKGHPERAKEAASILKSKYLSWEGDE